MKKWLIKEKENIADVLVEIFGKDEKELFENLILAFSSIITEIKKIRTKVKTKLELTGESYEQLVFDFLERLIIIKDTQGLIFKKGDFILKKEKRIHLKAVLWGEKISDGIPIKVDIKAVTHHKFQVVKEKKGLKVRVVFDL